MANQSNQRPAKRSGGINATFLGAVFLGICILISGISIGGGVRKLNKTMEEKQLASTNTVTVPSDVGLSQKKYLTEAEAGEYLNLSTDKVIELIRTGEITEYVETATGYSISLSVLDDWFDNAAYQNKLKSNAPSVPSEDDESEE